MDSAVDLDGCSRIDRFSGVVILKTAYGADHVRGIIFSFLCLKLQL